MAEPLPATIQTTMARTQAVLASGRLSPWARARILGLRLDLPPAKVTRITVDCRTGRRTIESEDPPTATQRNPFERERVTAPAAILRKAPWTMRRILNAVATAFDIPVDDILGHRRSIRETRPRFAVYLLLAEAKYSGAKIGRVCKRDHTSAANGLKRAAILHEDDADWRALVDQVRAELAK